MSDCISKKHDGVLLYLCKANEHTRSESSYQSMRRAVLETEYKNELHKSLLEASELQKQDFNNIPQIDFNEVKSVVNENSVVALTKNNLENSVLKASGKLVEKISDIHNKISGELSKLEVIAYFDPNKDANINESLNNFIQNLAENGQITEEFKAKILAQKAVDVDDQDFALNRALKDIGWESGIAVHMLSDLLFSPQSNEIKQISSSKINNLITSMSSDSLPAPLTGEDNTNALEGE